MLFRESVLLILLLALLIYDCSDDVSYDFKLTQRPNEQVSLRTFCTNNNAAYVAEEETYGMKSYNGHSFKQEDLINNMTNFGIIMEIKGIENPFDSPFHGAQ